MPGRGSGSAHPAAREQDLPCAALVLAGEAPAAPATNPEILALEAMAANHCCRVTLVCQS